MSSKFPWTAVPAARSSAPVLKVKLWAVLGTLLLAAALGPLSFMLVASKSSDDVTVDNAADSSAAFAAQVAREYLTASPSGLPTARDVDENLGLSSDPEARKPIEFSALVPAGSVTRVMGEPPVQVQVHDFLVTVPSEDGATLFKLSVTTVLDDNGRPVVGALPSMAPWRSGSAGVPGAVLPDASTVEELPGAVKSRIDEWAEAYATGDTEAFRGITGNDPSLYAALGGFKVDSVEIVSSAPGGADDSSLVRVRLALTGTGANGFSAQSDFDLLVVSTSTEDPKIVAWGPPGSGPSLSDPNQPE